MNWLGIVLALLQAPQASVVPPTAGRGYYASPSGSRAGDGSEGRPWDLATALAGGRGAGRVQPGDTIWLRGGTYRGAFRSTVAGKPGLPVVVRQFPGERAIIDGASSRSDTWQVKGEYSVFWGFEVTNSDPRREAKRPGLIVNYAAHTKFINLTVHDGGVAFYTDAKYADVEIAGCIIYNNGWRDPEHGKGHAHGLYIKSYTGPLVARDNVVFNQFGYGIHAFTNASTGKLMNITIEGNVSFNNGSHAERRTLTANILLGGDGYAAGATIRNNMTYFSPVLRAEANVVVGWRSLRNGDVVVERNYFAGGSPVFRFGYWTAARVSDDTLIGIGSRGPLVSQREPGARGQIWRNNVELTAPPARTRVFVRPNPHEAGRAHVVVYNWGRQADVDVDVRGILAPGDRYEVRNVQDLFGAPVLRGTVSGGVISIPMRGVQPAAPIGLATSPAPQTGPEFDTFLVTRTSP